VDVVIRVWLVDERGTDNRSRKIKKTQKGRREVALGTPDQIGGATLSRFRKGEGRFGQRNSRWGSGRDSAKKLEGLKKAGGLQVI